MNNWIPMDLYTACWVERGILSVTQSSSALSGTTSSFSSLKDKRTNAKIEQQSMLHSADEKIWILYKLHILISYIL